MISDNYSPCELIFKIGCNEYDEISTAINTLLRSCSIKDQKFFFIEQQIQPTTYFNSFTNQLLTSKLPIQCQSLSCIIFLTENILKQKDKKDFFKSQHIWNFHHKIELRDEYKQVIARQDYYELSHLLPLWSISNVPSNQQIIIRFNVFTNNFDLMLQFYKNLFQCNPNSSKIGFVLFNLSSKLNKKYLYQFSIKYSPSIQSYTISQNVYFKFRLNNLNNFIHEYTSKLFTINQYEYYIYDPDGNLLHLYLNKKYSNRKESISTKSLIHTTDSGFGDSSDPSIKLFNTNITKIYPINNDIDIQSHSSNDSVQWSSLSSNEFNTFKRNISVRSARKNEIDYQLKQQQRTAVCHVPEKHQQSSLYNSEPGLSNTISYNNRYYSSMNNMKRSNKIPSFSTNYLKSLELENSDKINSSSFGYLNAFLLKKQQQQSNHSQNVKELISQFERPKSTPLNKNILQQQSKSNKSEWENNNQIQTPRINIGITLDSRLRKTPVLDMLRSTTMKSDIIEPQRLNKMNSFIPIARF